MNDPSGHPARYWQKGEKTGEVICQLCPRCCHLKNGQHGFCFVRQNIDGKLILTTYGRTSGVCVDPIEKKPLYHFLPGSAVLSFGTIGCNLGCKFCQNWEISRAKNAERLNQEAPPAALARAAIQFHCKSVALTYNEPIVFAEYAIDVAKACREAGVKTVAVTAGYISEDARAEFFEYIDAANVDLKAFSDRFYRALVNASLQPVLDTIRFIKKKTKVWLELTTLIIPGENDSEDEIEQMAQWILDELGPDTPVHFSAFHPDFQMPDHPATAPATLQKARAIALAKGLRYVYTGNVRDPKGESTFCHHCQKVLIRRDGYAVAEYHLKNNICKICGAVCAGFFEGKPGKWGERRVPVKL